jgi:hypothetical protein
VAVGYSRSAVSNAEGGHPDVARVFWVRCDKALKTGRLFSVAFDQVRAAEHGRAGSLAGVVPSAGLGEFRRVRQAISSDEVAAALAGYRDVGWTVQPHQGGIALVTGGVMDALELPRTAGMLAISLWRYSQGRADVVRRLPALPHPAQALAVITAGDRCYFLAAGGGCPWPGSDPATAAGGGTAVIRWHAGGGLIPAPPSRLADGQLVAWAHLPSQPVRLAPATALLGLLGTAAGIACPGQPGLILPGGVRVLPAPAPPA